MNYHMLAAVNEGLIKAILIFLLLMWLSTLVSIKNEGFFVKVLLLLLVPFILFIIEDKDFVNDGKAFEDGIAKGARLHYSCDD